jgi:DNA-binding transcriptional regulator YiaG
MSNFAKTIKDEMTRLAKREARRACRPLNDRIRQLSRMVSAQGKTIAEFEKIIAKQQEEIRQDAPVPEAAPLEEVKKSRISPRLVKIQRKRLQLTQHQFADLLSVSVAAVRSWEQGRAMPKADTMATFIAVRKLKPAEVWDRLKITPPAKKKARKTKRVSAKQEE